MSWKTALIMLTITRWTGINVSGSINNVCGLNLVDAPLADPITCLHLTEALSLCKPLVRERGDREGTDSVISLVKLEKQNLHLTSKRIFARSTC